MTEPKNQLTSKEVTIIQIALGTLIEDMEAASKNQTLPFNPEARDYLRDMLSTAKSALEKIAITSGHAVLMNPYQEGDEK